jgi:hypothetical protein
MLTTAKDWGYACREIAIRKLVLLERSSHVAAHFTRSQVESIFTLAKDPWRTFFILLTMTGMRAGEALGLQWGNIDFDHQCIHIRRSAWYGKAQSTKSGLFRALSRRRRTDIPVRSSRGTGGSGTDVTAGLIVAEYASLRSIVLPLESEMFRSKRPELNELETPGSAVKLYRGPMREAPFEMPVKKLK